MKAVVFDLDGTLVDAYAAVEQSVNFVMRRLGRRRVTKRAIVRAVGWGERHLLSQFVPPEDLDRAVSWYRAHHGAALERKTRLLPGAKRVLKKLDEKGYLLAVASNRATPFTRRILRVLDIGKYFDYVLCRDKVRYPKPHPQMLRVIAGRFGIPPREALFVGDMTVDIEAGKKAGMKTVAVTTGSSLSREIRALEPWRIIRCLRDVLPVLEETEGSRGRNKRKQRKYPK